VYVGGHLLQGVVGFPASCSCLPFVVSLRSTQCLLPPLACHRRPSPRLCTHHVTDSPSIIYVSGVADAKLGRPCEDTITLSVQWANRHSSSTGTAVYTASWIAPKVRDLLPLGAGCHMLLQLCVAVFDQYGSCYMRFRPVWVMLYAVKTHMPIDAVFSGCLFAHTSSAPHLHHFAAPYAVACCAVLCQMLPCRAMVCCGVLCVVQGECHTRQHFHYMG
jgi:hypothetical protein